MFGNIKKRRGFTIIEALISAGIFLIVFVIVADIAIIFTKHPEKIIRQKQVEADLSYAVEKISQKIRVSDIDYTTYGTITNPASNLYLINDIDGQITVSQSSGQLLLNSDSLTSDNVAIDQLRFYLYPLTEPFCDTYATGLYVACASSNQPRVTMSILAHHADDSTVDINLQTTISSRLYER